MMKNFTKLFALVAVMFGFSLGASAQVSATADASATIIAPITIVWASDMNFGNIAVQPGTGGTVALDNAGGRLKTSGVTLPAVTGTVSAASFTVGGVTGSTYAITMPTTDIIISDGGLNTMTVGTFTSNLAATSTLTSGTEILNIGATLTVGAGQAPGLYTLADGISVTVNYN